jgi:hypothetical protein
MFRHTDETMRRSAIGRLADYILRARYLQPVIYRRAYPAPKCIFEATQGIFCRE